MYRGTTPTLTFTLPIDTGSITVLSVAVAQAGQVKIEKALSDVHLDRNVVSCTLTEAETLSLTAGTGVDAKIQLRVGVGAQRMASQVFAVPVERILRDGAL